MPSTINIQKLWDQKYRDESVPFPIDTTGGGSGGGVTGIYDVTAAPYSCVPDSTGATNHTPAFQQAVNDAASAGGGIVWVPPTTSSLFFNLKHLELKNHVYLVGAGPRSSKLAYYGTVEDAMIQNHVSTDSGATDPNAQFVGVQGLFLYGNMGTTSGTVQTSSGSHIGIYLANDPSSGSKGAADDSTDSDQWLSNLYISAFRDFGVYSSGRSNNGFNRVTCNSIGQNTTGTGGLGIGILIGQDTKVTQCTTGQTVGPGFLVQSPSVQLTNCKAFFAGKGVINAPGFEFDSGCGNATISNCVAQDCGGDGFYFNFCKRVTGSGLVADSNSGEGSALHVGFYLHGALDCNLQGVTAERHVATPYQQNGAAFDSSAKGNHIDFTHGPDVSGGAVTVGDPINVGGSLPGNSFRINKEGSVKAATFASSFTPDFYEGNTILLTLTGPITINAPLYQPHAGSRMTFIFTQDSTGSRTVTWNSAYTVTSFTVTGTANARSAVTFAWDGTTSPPTGAHWVQI